VVSGQMIVDLEEDVPDGDDFVFFIDDIGLGDVSESASGFRRDDAGQGRGDPVGGDDVVPGDVFDFFQVVLGGEVPHGDDLKILFPAVGHVEVEVPEVAQLLGGLHGVPDGVLLLVPQGGGG